jgi:Zn-dependent metalloprotease
MLRKLAEDPAHRERALRTLEITEQLRGARQWMPIRPLVGAPGVKHRIIYDARHLTTLPGTKVEEEGGAKSKDVAVAEAYDYSGDTYDFYHQVFARNSLDDHGLPLKSTVHYDEAYDNAFWNGEQMVYGDGDGSIFERFTIARDVIGHELTHGVTQYSARLQYQGQPGALNESMSDVFGSLVKQWSLNQTADKADWLIGAGLFTKNVHGVALRSMKAPGTAYDDPTLGKDPQPADMAHYVKTTADSGGVHINSGIPNRAFYLVASGIGGKAWQKAGLIWYRTLTGALKPSSDFQAAADATASVAATLFGPTSVEHKAVLDAWSTVGVKAKPLVLTSLAAEGKTVPVD